MGSSEIRKHDENVKVSRLDFSSAPEKIFFCIIGQNLSKNRCQILHKKLKFSVILSHCNYSFLHLQLRTLRYEFIEFKNFFKILYIGYYISQRILKLQLLGIIYLSKHFRFSSRQDASFSEFVNSLPFTQIIWTASCILRTAKSLRIFYPSLSCIGIVTQRSDFRDRSPT